MKSIYLISLLTLLANSGYAQTTDLSPITDQTATDPTAHRDQRRMALRTALKSQNANPVQGEQRKQLSAQERQALRQQLHQQQQSARDKP